MLNYSKLYKAGKCKFPDAFDLLNKVRKDREILNRGDKYIRLKSHLNLSKGLNIMGEHEKIKKMIAYYDLIWQIYIIYYQFCDH